VVVVSGTVEDTVDATVVIAAARSSSSRTIRCRRQDATSSANTTVIARRFVPLAPCEARELQSMPDSACADCDQEGLQ
jgi:hypothetical protein